MQNLQAKDTIHKVKKTKSDIKKELEDSIAKSGRNENADVQENVNGCSTSEEAVKANQEFEQIIQNKKSDIAWLAYYQGQIFQKFREKEQFFSDMILKKLVLEVVRMEKYKEKSKLIFSINEDEQKLRLSDFLRCDVDDVRENTCIKFKENSESVCNVGADEFHDSPSLLKKQDAAITYSKCIKKVVMSLQYIWYVFE